MKKAKNLSALILISAMLCYWGGVLIGCDNDSGSVRRPNHGFTDIPDYDDDDLEEDDIIDDDDFDDDYVPPSLIDENVYADDFYSTEYDKYYVRDVQRSPAYPSEYSATLTVYGPKKPYRPDTKLQYTNSELENIKYFVLRQSAKEDCYDEYAVSLDGKEEKIGTAGIIQCFGKEGFLFLCGGSDGKHYGTFFFTKYGYNKFKKKESMTYEYENLNLTHADVTEIFGSAH